MTMLMIVSSSLKLLKKNLRDLLSLRIRKFLNPKLITKLLSLPKLSRQKMSMIRPQPVNHRLMNPLSLPKPQFPLGLAPIKPKGKKLKGHDKVRGLSLPLAPPAELQMVAQIPRQLERQMDHMFRLMTVA